jgi:hypothetical protein
MTQSAAITINYDNCSASQECSGRLLVITPTEYTPGTRITFTVYGITSAMVANLSLWKGNRTMGAGSRGYSGSMITETVSFDGVEKVQLTYPVAGSLTMTAKTDLMGRAEGTARRIPFANKGSNLNSKMKRIGYSCVGTNNGLEIYGSVKIRYNRAGNSKSWHWTVPNESGDYWFYLCEGDKLLVAEKLTVDASETENTDPQEVTIVVREYSSEALIVGASVSVDGVPKGVTDENGTIVLGRVAVGTHIITITKDGYVSSNEDDLENDSFTLE